MSKESYLDKYDTNEEKTYQLILNLVDLCKFKEISVKDLCVSVGVNPTYISYCKKHKEIKFSILLDMCDKLGVSIGKLMTFSYANLVTNKQLHENEERLKSMRSEMAKLEMLVKEQKKALNMANMNLKNFSDN